MTVAWFNGRLVEGVVRLDPSDRGLTLGDGLFETIAVFNAKPAYLGPHLDRLESGARLLGIEFSRAMIESGASEIIAAQDRGSRILRLSLTRGPGARGLAASTTGPTVLMTLSPSQKEALNQPVRLATSSIRRNEHSPASRLKTLSYVDNVLAAREAAKAGADDALMLNTAGRPVCTTISNIFIVRARALITPPVAEGVLPGIIRARLLGLAKRLGFDPTERPLTLAELLAADALFLTNSVRLIRPVVALDNSEISRAKGDRVLSLFDALCEEIFRETGGDPRMADGRNL
jgi:branched-chain amino acid aminotransferase